MLSIELQILIACIRVVLLNKPKKELLDLLEKSSIDWKKLNKMAVYHQIRPIVYEAFRQIKFKNDFTDNLELFTKKQAIQNIVDSQETAYVLDFFKQHSIPALPYKGQLFLEYLYQNKPLRESGDIDIIVQPQNLRESLKLLLSDGYELSINREFSDALFEEIHGFYGREIGLDKKTKLGKKVHIDFHWGINESFHEYPIGVDDFFEGAKLNDFNKKQVLLPSIETIFKMLLNHHGGRGCWLRLKDMCDFIAFRKGFFQFTTPQMLEIAQSMEMVNTFKQGIGLSDTFFSDTLIKEIPKNQKISKDFFVFWEKSNHYAHYNPRARLSYEKIYRSLQDKKWSWIKTLQINVNVLSIPNLMERKRLIVFPDRFVYLNFFAKVLSGVWMKVKSY